MNRMNVDQRRSKLIGAAIEVMLRDGVTRTTTRAIVTQAGMTTGAFHYSFFSKEELELEVMRALNEHAFEPTVLEGEGHRGGPADLIDRIVTVYVDGLVAEAPRRQLAFELSLHAMREPGLRDAAIKHYRGKLDRTETFLERTAASGGFSWRMSTGPLAQLALSTAEGTAYTWLLTEQAAGQEQLHRALTGFLCSLVDQGRAAV